MKLIILILFVCSVTFSFAQNDSRKDSIKYYLKLGQKYLNSEEYQNAYDSFDKGIQNYNRSQNLDTILPQLYNNRGVAAYFQGNLAKSIESYETAKDLYESLSEPLFAAQTKLNLGLVYKKKGMYSRAYQILIDCTRYFESNHDFNALSSAYNALGNIRKETKDYEQAVSYHHKALNIREKLKYDKGIAQSMHNLGQVYLLDVRLDSANFYLEKALDLKRKLNKPILLASTLSQLGTLKMSQNNLDEAQSYFEEALIIREKSDDKIDIATSLVQLSSVKLVKGKVAEVDKLLSRAWQLATSVDGNRTLLEIAEQRIEWSFMNGNKDISIWYEHVVELKETLFSEEKQESIERLEIEFEVEKNKKILESQVSRNKSLKNKNSELETDNKELLSWVIVVVLIGFILSGLFVLNFRKRKVIERQSNEIENIHVEYKHRTKNHFSIILSMLNISDETNDLKSKVVEKYKSRVEAIAIINDHMVYMEQESSDSVRIKTYLTTLIENIHLSFGGDAKARLEFKIQMSFMSHNQALKVGIILNELLTNSFKYAKPNGDDLIIQVSFTQNDSHYNLIVCDNGSLLEIETKGNSGLGKDLIDRFIRDLNGTLTVEHSDEGYCTIIVIPKK